MMKREANNKQRKEKFTSNIFELINYFDSEPWIQLPYAYFRCDFSELVDECFSSKFFRLNLRNGEVKCVESETLEECCTPYCCNVLNDLRDIRECKEIQRLEEEKNEELL